MNNKNRNVVIFSFEDGVSNTWVPRCKNHGADLSRIFLCTEIFELNETGVARVREILNEFKPILVVFDTLQNYFGSKDLNKIGDVAAVMGLVQDLAVEFKCAIVFIRHLKKGNDKALYKGMGSMGIVGAARSDVFLALNPKNKDELVLIHSKSNCGALGPSLSFTNDRGRLVLNGKSDLSAEELMTSMPDTAEERSALDDAIEFLREALRFGPVPQKQMKKDVEGAGFSFRTLELAKRKLGIKSQKIGNEWFWPGLAPQNNQEPTQDRKAAKNSHVENDCGVAGLNSNDSQIEFGEIL